MSARDEVRVRPLEPAEHMAFAAARFAAGRRQPYLNAALFALSPWAAEGLGTFGVDRRWCIYLDPHRLTTWSVEECAGVLLHEVGHLVRDHARRGDALGLADHQRRFRWNVAGDLAINDDLVADGVPLPANTLTPAGLGLPSGRLEEEYFALVEAMAERGELDLVAPPPMAGPGSRGDGDPSPGAGAGDCGSAGDGHARPWESEDEDEPGGPRWLTEPEASGIRLQVARAVRETGTSPAGWQRWAVSTEPTTSDWRRTLRTAIRRPRSWRSGNLDATWQRPHRRGDERSDLLRPGTRSPAFEVAVVLDTSASMSDAEIGAALAEIHAISRQCGLRRLWFVACDARPRTPVRVQRVEATHVVGGGGTDLRPAISLLSTLRPQPDVAVVITDGWTPWPTAVPRHTELVVATTDRPCPLPGVTNVHIEVEEPAPDRWLRR